ncbi:MAG: hypothetical protein ABIJ18_04825 [archaeon]
MTDILQRAKKGIITLVALGSFISLGSYLNANEISCQCTPRESTPSLKDWNYAPGIEKQRKDASPKLTDLLNCMQSKLSTEATILSISDSAGFEHCQDNYDKSCAHTKNSAHYGCKDHYEGSLAVDFKNEGNACELATVAYECRARKAFGPRSAVSKCNLPQSFFQGDGYHEGHVHISVSAPEGYHKCN